MTFEDRVEQQRVVIMQDWIAKTHDTISKLERQVDTVKLRGEYYLHMQRHILASPEAMEAWQTFMLTVQLVVTEKIPGITA